MNTTAPQRSEIERLLDQTNYRRRFEEMLGARAPQYISSIITGQLNTSIAVKQP